MTKLTHSERDIRRARNVRRNRKDKVRKKYKLPDTVDKMNPDIQAILNKTR